jgi:hypothetical protein
MLLSNLESAHRNIVAVGDCCPKNATGQINSLTMVTQSTVPEITGKLLACVKPRM